MSETYSYLRRCSLFENLDTEDLGRVTARSQVVSYRRGEPIYGPDDEARDLYYVASGRVKICQVGADDKQSIIGFVEPGEIFGELSAIQTGPRGECAEAAENSTIVAIPIEDVMPMLEQSPAEALEFAKIMASRRRLAERRLGQMLFRSNRERLVQLLTDLVRQYGVPTDDGIALRIKLTHQDIANIVGSTRETVTVILGQLQEEGLINVARRRIKVVDFERLVAGAGDNSSSAGLPPEKSERSLAAIGA